VAYAHLVGTLEKPWPESRMNSVGSSQNGIRNLSVNERCAVSSVRVGVLRGRAFCTSKARTALGRS
jgi:hypothetical protein